MKNEVKLQYISENIIFMFEGSSPSFRANLLFGYVQSGPERTFVWDQPLADGGVQMCSTSAKMAALEMWKINTGDIIDIEFF